MVLGTFGPSLQIETVLFFTHVRDSLTSDVGSFGSRDFIKTVI